MPRLLASIEKAGGLIGYEPIVDFEEGLAGKIEWFQDNWDKVVQLADFPPGMSSAVKDADITSEPASSIRRQAFDPVKVLTSY